MSLPPHSVKKPGRMLQEGGAQKSNITDTLLFFRVTERKGRNGLKTKEEIQTKTLGGIGIRCLYFAISACKLVVASVLFSELICLPFFIARGPPESRDKATANVTWLLINHRTGRHRIEKYNRFLDIVLNFH
ncbi:Transmembrane protein 72 [Caenorhabditis elegans]|uniref:Transmembrane protein 72 n=1 Tax=Caenorhabditis elegans TaxID=6239 RepID=Q20842_CAEEL|nr:Transmembrane protein 72 [Caenorhabditis elegans]CCD64432.2 Transmembrane protein 72 [Caenorhabditis elegans]